MTWLIVVATALTALSLALLLRPVLRRRPPSPRSRAEFDLQVFRDQLTEVDRDQARGLLGQDEAEAARTEVKRRMLTAAEAVAAAPAEPVDATGSGRRGGIGLAIALALVLPTAATVLYLELGAPGGRDQPLAQRRAQEMIAGGRPAGARSTQPAQGDAGQGNVDSTEPNEPASLEEAAVRLAEQLQSHPENAGGWFLLGRAYVTLQRYPEAIDALVRASELAPDQPEVAGAYAEALIAQANGQIEEPARIQLRRFLELDPTSPEARFMLALDRAQQGDLRGAMQGWVDLIALAPGDAPWLPVVREHLDRAAQRAGVAVDSVQPSADALELAAEQAAQDADAAVEPATPAGPAAAAGDSAGPGPAHVAAAAAMSEADRAQMIRGMVERLAARLQREPDDIEGWRRLARAYDVLGEAQKAGEARARIAALERR